MQESEIDNWRIEAWHPDLGDPIAELRLLQECARQLIRKFGGAKLALRCPEPGYLSMAVSFTREVAEVLVVPHHRIAVFATDGTELYFDSTDGAAEYLHSLVSASAPRQSSK
jgi:hypothetical protein